jgi:hypothetical protein
MGCREGARGGSEAAAREGAKKPLTIHSHKIYYIYFIINTFDREGPKGADLYIL